MERNSPEVIEVRFPASWLHRLEIRCDEVPRDLRVSDRFMHFAFDADDQPSASSGIRQGPWYESCSLLTTGSAGVEDVCWLSMGGW